MANDITIVLADDHAILRSGLRLLLNSQEGWQIVGEAGTMAQTLELVRRTRPTVLLLDLNMPDGNALSILPELRSVSPASKILVLTMHEDGNYLQQAIQGGVSGYVLKKAVDAELLTAIQAVLRNELYVHPAMTQHLLKPTMPENTPNANPWSVLSEREFDVLKRVALGYTNTEIAEELFLSTKTVETYRARGMEKLGLETRAQLVKSAIENHLLE